MSTITQFFQKAFPNFLWFQGLQYLFHYKYDVKMSQNFVAATHATGSSLMAAGYLYTKNLNLYNVLTRYSTGYFIFDFIYCMRHLKNNSLKYAYLYHHLASIYIVNMPVKYGGPLILFWAELSNIPSYFVYYYLKKDKKKKSELWKKIQLFSYLGIRIPILGYLLYQKLKTLPDKHTIYPVIPVYIMGIIWSGKLLQAMYN